MYVYKRDTLSDSIGRCVVAPGKTASTLLVTYFIAALLLQLYLKIVCVWYNSGSPSEKDTYYDIEAGQSIKQ
jgi:hypothetical protein